MSSRGLTKVTSRGFYLGLTRAYPHPFFPFLALYNVPTPRRLSGFYSNFSHLRGCADAAYVYTN
jgi:hypothetical protein